MLSALSPHLVGCLPGGAWTQAFTPHRRKHQALNYPNRGSRITCGHTPDRLAPIKWAEPGAVSNDLHKVSSLRPWVRMCLHARSCGWAATELQIPLTVQCAQGWRCLWSWRVNSCRNGYSHRGRVPKLLQCSCDPRPVTQRYVCSYWHRWTVPMLLQHSLFFSLLFLVRTQCSFPGIFFLFFFFNFKYSNNFIASDADFSHILIHTAEPREYFKCYWRTVSPSSVCAVYSLPQGFIQQKHLKTFFNISWGITGMYIMRSLGGTARIH